MIPCPRCGEMSPVPAPGTKGRCAKCSATIEPPRVKRADDDDDEGGSYSLVETQQEEKKVEEGPKKKVQKAIIKVRRRSIGDLEKWETVNFAMTMVTVGVCFWGLAQALYGIYLFLGLVQGPEYARPVAEFLLQQVDDPLEPGAGEPTNRIAFIVAMVGGSDFHGANVGILVASQVCGWLQTGCWIFAYILMLRGAPDSYGASGQALTLMIFSVMNQLVYFIFVFLPIIGAFGYTMVPLIGPEMASADFNMERRVPLQVFWSGMPMLEVFLALMFILIRYLEPIFIGIYVRSCAKAMKDPFLEQNSVGYQKLGFGLLYIVVCYFILSLAGTSPVLVKVLRVIYACWFGFLVGFIVRTALVCGALKESLEPHLKPED